MAQNTQNTPSSTAAGNIGGASANSSGQSYWSQVGEALGNADGPMMTAEQYNELYSAVDKAWNTPTTLPNPQWASGVADTVVAGAAAYVAGTTGGAATVAAGATALSFGYGAYQNFSAAAQQPWVTMSPSQWVGDAFHNTFRWPYQ
jgi:hypothetical protein